LGGSFFLSAVLNFVLARLLVRTDPALDLERFNQEISSMWAWSMAVIALPSMLVSAWALWVIFRGIREHAGLTLEEVVVGMEDKA
jgi:hypothetical protein